MKKTMRLSFIIAILLFIVNSLTYATTPCPNEIGYRINKESNSVIFYDFRSRIETKIDDADIKSFETLPRIGCDTVYAKDKNYVYYLGETVEDADPKSFEIYKTYFGRDKYHLYSGKESYELKDFKLIKDGPWAANINHVFYNGKITLMNPDTFGIVENSWETHAKDNNYVYSYNNLIEGADPSTFRMAEGYYASDANNFYLGKKIEGANEDSLIILDKGYAKDSKNVYKMQEILPGFDAETFEVFLQSWYTKDKNGVYSKDKLIPDADPDTFQGTSLGYGRDKNNKYRNDRIIGPNDNGLEKTPNNGPVKHKVIYKNTKEIPLTDNNKQSFWRKILDFIIWWK